MNRTSLTSVAPLVSVALFLLSGPLLSEDWPHLRGPRYDGSTAPAAALANTAVSLELAWRRPLGSGFAVPIVAADRVVASFSTGQEDVVAAFSLESGDELWRVSLAPTYRGHDGSPDGPNAAPTSDGERVFAVAPRGELVAIDLEGGAVLWRRHLSEDFGGEPPHYGYAVSPLVVGNSVVVQGGGPGSALTALDPASGAVRWHNGDLVTDYCSPILATVGDENQILAVGRHHVAGFEPTTGRELWRHPYREGPETISLLAALSEDRLLIRSFPESAMLSYSRGEDGVVEIAELWRKAVFKSQTAMPVFHQGVLYGFDGRFLSAVDADSGERRWKSRPPGGVGVALAGSDLVVLASDGAVVVAAADPEGYRERARLRALDTTGSSWPVVAGELIVMRNLDQLASVRIVAGSAAERQKTAPAPTATSRLERELQRAAASTSPAFALDRLLAATAPPAVERTAEGALVTFVWRGEAEDVGLAGTFLEDHEELAMQRLAGTDVFHLTLPIAVPGLYEYWLRVDYEDGSRPDPANRERGPSPWFWVTSDVSVLDLRAQPEPELPLYGGDQRGRIETLPAEAAGREIDVYLPATMAAGERLPLLLTFDRHWLDRGGGLANTLDHLLEEGRCSPFIAAAIDLAFSDSDPRSVGPLLDSLMAAIGERYPIDRQRVHLLGSLGGALVAALAALERPQVIDSVALFSAVDLSFMSGILDAIDQAEVSGDADGEPHEAARRAFVHYTDHGGHSRETRWDQSAYNRRLIEKLGKLGFEVTVDHPAGSLGWATWRRQSARALEVLCDGS